MLKAFLCLLWLSDALAVEIKTIDSVEGRNLVALNQCELHIAFGSYGSGTPLKVIAQIDKKLLKNKDIRTFHRWHYGKEGEVDYCLNFKDETSLLKWHQEIAGLIPKESREGYTTLMLKGEQTHKTNWPKN